MKFWTTTAAAIILASTASIAAASNCASGKTLTEGTLTVATGNPAYFPWVIDDAPETGQGFEAAVAYALAAEMGFDADHVTWIRTSFDQAIQPGVKDFDINLQQYSITPERAKMVDFSDPYYTSAMAVLTTKSVVEGGATPNVDSLKTLVWGADANTTAVPMLADLIAPEQAPLLYDDNADVTAAMQAGQIDAALFDLPTALYLSAVVLNDGAMLGQFPADRSDNPDQFGVLMEKDSKLKSCVNAALAALKDNGKLAEIEAKWMQATTGVPLIK